MKKLLFLTLCATLMLFGSCTTPTTVVATTSDYTTTQSSYYYYDGSTYYVVEYRNSVPYYRYYDAVVGWSWRCVPYNRYHLITKHRPTYYYDRRYRYDYRPSTPSYRHRPTVTPNRGTYRRPTTTTPYRPNYRPQGGRQQPNRGGRPTRR